MADRCRGLIEAALRRWFGLSLADRRAIGRVSLLLLALVSTHSAFGAMALAFDRLLASDD
jgi:hypothetical protein